MEVVVFGNATLDVICKTVDDVPRYESLAFEQVAVTPGGCGSNVAIGLAALGVSTALVSRIGRDDAGELVQRYWSRFGVELRWVESVADRPTGTSVGLVDSQAQPRFIHISGANATLTADSIDLAGLLAEGMRALHVAGFFVLPGVLDDRLALNLAAAREQGVFTSLDVVRSPRMADPSPLWPCLPHLDVFLCNDQEGLRITGESEPERQGAWLRARGAQAVIVKLGAAGCWLASDPFTGQIAAPAPSQVVDTTGAGDAFAAGLLAAWVRGADLPAACQAGNEAGARTVTRLGALGAWI